MIQITQFAPEFSACLPQTHSLLQAGRLVVHDSIERVVLHGSRGPFGHPREDSDVDLSLVIAPEALAAATDREELLRSAFLLTKERWQGRVECDLAVVFDRAGCGLGCLARRTFDPALCPTTTDCLGIYKIGHGFSGCVTGPGIDCRKIYPLMIIWQRRATSQPDARV